MTMITDSAPADTAAADTSATTANDTNTAAADTNTTAAATDTKAEAKTPEQIAADETAAKAADESAKAAGAPEKYADFTAPEGTALDGKVMEQFSEAAKELNLPQDAAQKLIDKMAPIMAARNAEQVEQFSDEWTAASKSDKEFGGEKLTESMTHAKRALDAFATPELKTILNETKLGNHPELVRFMVRAGKALGEEKIITGGNQASAGDKLSKFYDAPKKK